VWVGTAPWLQLPVLTQWSNHAAGTWLVVPQNHWDSNAAGTQDLGRNGHLGEGVSTAAADQSGTHI
jgi:hypothetical protein